MNQQELWARARDYTSTFLGGAGEKVLRDLEERFSNRSSFVPGDPYHTSIKEGHREVYLHIQTMMRLGLGPEPEDDPDILEDTESHAIEGA